MILDAKARDKKEKDFYEEQKKREEERKLAMERAQKNKAEREAREKAEREAREKAAKEQATKTAKERDAEEKAYYESPVKDMHQAKENDTLQYMDIDTREHKSETVTTSSDYADDILWREAQDEKVYISDKWKRRSDRKKVLVFYEPENFSEQAQDQMSVLEKQGYNVDEVAITSNKQFVDYWNASASKYDDIYFLTHGGPHAVSMGEGDENNLAVKNSEYTRSLHEAYRKDPQNNTNPDELEYIEDLKDGEFNVHLLSCNAGHLNHVDDNVAQAFDRITTGKVYASDGNVSYYPQY